MDPITVGSLVAPGATLHYEITGAGPALLLIPGGGGEAAVYTMLAGALADRFNVITYDRRGFGRSALDAPPEDATRLGIDVEDASRLIHELTGGRAYVFGNSSGAIVGLELLLRYPERVEMLVAHEPPLLCTLSDGDRYLKLFQDVHETWRRDGMEAAMQQFSIGIGVARPPRPPQGATPEARDLLTRLRRNTEYWLEHELRQYPAAILDLATLQTASGQLVLANGSDSKGTMPYYANLALASRLGLRVAELPGDHFGFVRHPSDFADRLAEALRGSGLT